MAVNYGPRTKDYIKGLKAERDGLDPKAENLADLQKAIDQEISAAEKNLKQEEKDTADAEEADQ